MQAFADSIRKTSIKDGVLTAECKKADNKTWVSSSVNLNDYIGNVNGKFVLGGKNFTKHAQEVSFADGILSAKFKNPEGHWIVHKVNLSENIHSKDGIIVIHGIESTKPSELNLERTLSAGSAASSASMATMSSMATSFSTASSMTSVATSATHTAFKSSSFRQFSKQLLLQEACTNFRLKGSFLHCDVHHADGRVHHVSFDLDQCIGVSEGRLVWDASGFSKHCTSIVLDGLWLTAKCRQPVHHEQYIHARLDISTRLRLEGEVIICLETNKKLSTMLSEVPWMKFRVIAEPDLSVFSSHPVVQQTMVRIAESTVEHVTTEMHKMLTIAMESAIIAITASAMKHVSAQMEHSVQDAVGYAVASPSATQSEFLHITRGGAHYGLGGMAMGGMGMKATMGVGLGNGVNGTQHNGAHYGTANGYIANGGSASLSRSVSESSAYSMSMESHSESASTVSATSTVAAVSAVEK